MRQITVEAAYAEACLALGEAVVVQRLLTAELKSMESPSDDGQA